MGLLLKATSNHLLIRRLYVYRHRPDLFGTEIPCSNFATIGEDVGSALMASMILEETAEAVHYAMLRGRILPLSEDVVKRGYDVYHSTYGQ